MNYDKEAGRSRNQQAIVGFETNLEEDYNYDGATSSDDDQEVVDQEGTNDQVPETEEFDPLLDPYVGKEFNNDEEAYLFYNAFAKRKGFGIRKDKSRRSIPNGGII